MKKLAALSGCVMSLLLIAAAPAYAACSDLPDHATLKKALTEARKANNGGLNFDMWGTIVDRSGIVCVVTYTGANEGSQWPGSRAISAQKATTANAYSLNQFAVSTANLYAVSQPGSSMYGLADANPVDVSVIYAGDARTYGTEQDPMIGKRPGGVNTYGGGLALYNAQGRIVGGLGVSGDTACADHNIAWRTRSALGLDFVPAGLHPDKNDNINYDIPEGSIKSITGFGHPECGGAEKIVAGTLPQTHKVGGGLNTPAKAPEPAATPGAPATTPTPAPATTPTDTPAPATPAQ